MISLYFWRWWCDLAGVTHVPKLVTISIVVPLNDLSAIILSSFCTVEDFTAVSVDNMSLFSFYFCNAEFLSCISFGLFSSEYFGSILFTFYCEISSFSALYIVAGTILHNSELLVFPFISFPYDCASFKISILSNIQHQSTMAWSQWIILLPVFTIFVLLTLPESERHILLSYFYIKYIITDLCTHISINNM